MKEKDNSKSKKVFLGMSGGVDSSVSALLLKEAGFDVTGVFLKVWQPDFMECNWKEDRRDAMRVAAQIGIPFITINAEKEYKEGVVDYMVNEYKVGRTPNPDVMCNNTVKFGLFYKKAMEMGADYIATGHYADTKKVDDEKFLYQAKDTEKDQTYFLWNISREALQKTLFPIGPYHKKEIRNIAQKKGLFTGEKKDSQGLCFIGKVSMKDFLSHFLKLEKGDVLNTGGQVIGMHDGALLYTVGQRHGFTITEKTPDDKPYYVAEKNVDDNTIVVSFADTTEKDFTADKIALSQVNWLADVVDGDQVWVRIRYRQPLFKAKLCMSEDSVMVQFEDSQKNIAVGQSCVIYKNSVCLGGGIIETVG